MDPNREHQELLQENGLILPEPGDHYVIKRTWFVHPWTSKMDGPCQPGDVLWIRSVDLSNSTCSVILLTGDTNFTADGFPFMDLMIFTEKLEMMAAI